MDSKMNVKILPAILIGTFMSSGCVLAFSATLVAFGFLATGLIWWNQETMFAVWGLGLIWWIAGVLLTSKHQRIGTYLFGAATFYTTLFTTLIIAAPIRYAVFLPITIILVIAQSFMQYVTGLIRIEK